MKDGKLDIMIFRDEASKLSVDDLIAKRDELQTKMSQMILNSELILQIAIVESLIKSKAAKEE